VKNLSRETMIYVEIGSQERLILRNRTELIEI